MSASGSRREGGDLVFVGDVHLDRADEHLEAFLAFLDALAPGVGRLVFLGDLFNLWIGRRDLEQPHQRAVIDRLERLRRRGVVVRYLEGNRDFHVGAAYGGWALDEATDRGIVERFGGWSLFAIHGDLANPRDRHYRAWRRIARSRLAWRLLAAVPAGRRLRVVEGLEERLRRSNLEFKREFPEDEVRAYAARFLRRGHDAVVLGHFHVEKDLEIRGPRSRGRILILPEWKTARRYLRVTTRGRLRFENG